MAEESTGVKLDEVQALVSQVGYEVSQEGDSLLKVRDVDSGIVVRAALQENILFCTVSCTVLSEDQLSTDLMRAMLDAGNGISTSNFQVYSLPDGKVSITLNNFCKLQSLGDDDRDDILSCLDFLVVDVCAARDLFNGLTG